MRLARRATEGEGVTILGRRGQYLLASIHASTRLPAVCAY
jgi:hypothetical protein